MPAPSRPKRHPNRDAQAAEAREKARVIIPLEALDILYQIREERDRRPFPKRPKVKIVYHHQLPDADLRIGGSGKKQRLKPKQTPKQSATHAILNPL